MNALAPVAPLVGPPGLPQEWSGSKPQGYLQDLGHSSPLRLFQFSPELRIFHNEYKKL